MSQLEHPKHWGNSTILINALFIKFFSSICQQMLLWIQLSPQAWISWIWLPSSTKEDQGLFALYLCCWRCTIFLRTLKNLNISKTFNQRIDSQGATCDRKLCEEPEHVFIQHLKLLFYNFMYIQVFRITQSNSWPQSIIHTCTPVLQKLYECRHVRSVNCVWKKLAGELRSGCKNWIIFLLQISFGILWNTFEFFYQDQVSINSLLYILMVWSMQQHLFHRDWKGLSCTVEALIPGDAGVL